MILLLYYELDVCLKLVCELFYGKTQKFSCINMVERTVMLA